MKYTIKDIFMGIKMDNYNLLLVFVLLITLINACGSEKTTEPSQTGTITGFIYDVESTLPIRYSNVTSDPPTSAVTTDTTGSYTILNVEPQTYIISASKMGYSSGATNISVTAGNSTIADIFLFRDSTNICLE